MDYFRLLPEGCISEILSLTSPEDAGRLSVLSRGFKSAAESDIVWEKFLPPDYQVFLSESNSFLGSLSKKDLYISLCDSPILSDGGKLRISLDKKTGKKCCMVAAKEHEVEVWDLSSNSRFSRGARFQYVALLDIQGKIGTQILSKQTRYVVYLVFNIGAGNYSLETAIVDVRFINYENESEAEERASVVTFSGGRPRQNQPHRRVDGWMEIEMGSFFNDTGEDGDVEARLMDKFAGGRGGLIVQGIEFRPERRREEA